MRPHVVKDKLRLVKVSGDGNCLFRAISVATHGTEENHYTYRTKAMEYLRDNFDEFFWHFETPYEANEYYTSMSQSGTWGGELELSILSKLFQIKFLLHLSDGKVLPVSIQDYKRPILIL